MKYQSLYTYLSRYIELSEQDWNEIASRVTERNFNRGDLISSPGEINKYTNFIIKGSVRVFYIDGNGYEHNIQLGLPNWWLGDFSSYIMQQPGLLYTEALEATDALAFSYEDLQVLYDNVPKMERFFRLLIQKAYASFQSRVLSNLSHDAEERYRIFRNKYPEMDQHISQKHIASYLGISPEFLSKIKKRIAEKELKKFRP